METVQNTEFALAQAHDAHMLLSAQSISSEAKEQQAIFQREMELTCRDDLIVTRFVEAVKGPDLGTYDAVGCNDSSDATGEPSATDIGWLER